YILRVFRAREGSHLGAGLHTEPGQDHPYGDGRNEKDHGSAETGEERSVSAHADFNALAEDKKPGEGMSDNGDSEAEQRAPGSRAGLEVTSAESGGEGIGEARFQCRRRVESRSRFSGWFHCLCAPLREERGGRLREFLLRRRWGRRPHIFRRP